jgi:hypothetical protein
VRSAFGSDPGEKPEESFQVRQSVAMSATKEYSKQVLVYLFYGEKKTHKKGKCLQCLRTISYEDASNYFFVAPILHHPLGILKKSSIAMHPFSFS